VKPVEFVLNTAYSRTLGVSPFEVLFGVHPRLPLRALLESPHSFTVLDSQGEVSAEAEFQALWSGDEPLEYSQRVSEVISSLYPKVRDIQTKLFQTELAEAHKKAKGKVDFAMGEYVLIISPSIRSSLEFCWTGPHLVVGSESETMFLTKNLVDDSVSRTHVSRMFPYLAEDLPDDELRGRAAFPALLCEKVLQHRQENGNHLFFCKWFGVPLKDPRDPDAWFTWPECRFCPPVRKFCQDNRIKPRLH